jgi:prevent-host-death family protein
MTYVLPVTEARKEFLSLVDKVDEEYLRVDLTKNGRTKATLISPDYIDELEETIYTLTHTMKEIRQAKKDFREGKYITLETFLKGLHAGETVPASGKRAKKSAKIA